MHFIFPVGTSAVLLYSLYRSFSPFPVSPYNWSPFIVGAWLLIGIAILVAVFAATGGFGSAQAFSDGFAPAMGVSAALALVGAVAGLGLPGRRQVTFAPARAKA